jgi:hypothetical protein
MTGNLLQHFTKKQQKSSLSIYDNFEKVVLENLRNAISGYCNPLNVRLAAFLRDRQFTGL